VNNVLGSAQGFQRFGPQQAVSVGNDADEGGSSQFSMLISSLISE
jgi:hypothetical protein